MGQSHASRDCLSIMDDRQDARSTGNLSGVQRKRLLRLAGRGARNDNLSPLVSPLLFVETSKWLQFE